jgi:hypothetical protein
LGFFHSGGATKMLERATGQLCYDFPKNANYMVFKIRVQLSGKSIVTVETFTE